MNPSTFYLGDSVYLELVGGLSIVLFVNNGDTYRDGTLVKSNPIFIEPETLQSLLRVLKQNNLIA